MCRYYSKKKSPYDFIADRDWPARHVWTKSGTGFLYVVSPEAGPNRPVPHRVVRGKNPGAMRIKRKNDNDTIIDYIIHPDAGGQIPAFLMNRGLGRSLSTITDIQEHFQEMRSLSEWDENDGRCVGEVMCIKSKAEKHGGKGESKIQRRVAELWRKHKALQEVGDKYEWFEAMITRALENKLRSSRDVRGKSHVVSKKEGRNIGAGLALAMATNLTAEAGVDEWILRYRCLGEVDAEEVWFR